MICSGEILCGFDGAGTSEGFSGGAFSTSDLQIFLLRYCNIFALNLSDAEHKALLCAQCNRLFDIHYSYLQFIFSRVENHN